MSNHASGSTKVLFLAWGYSIHAYRRIKIFADDARFTVELVSNYRYEIPGVVCHPLLRAKSAPKKGAAGSGEVASRPLYKRIVEYLWQVLMVRVVYDLLVSVIDFCRLWRVYRRFRPDVVFLQTLLYPSYLAYMLPRHIPLMVTFWNGDVTWWAKWNGIERLFKKWLVGYGARRANAITVNSRAAFDATLSYGVNSENVHLIRYPGADLELFHPEVGRAPARNRLGIQSDHVVLCPRGIGGYLNADIILQAAVEVVKKYPNTLFHFVSGVGYALYLEEHRKTSRELGVEHNVRWSGSVAWEEMPDIYRSADVMVSISSNDSLPNCMLEAMACGTPVVMGDIAQIREWVTDGVNGLLVPPRDEKALAQALNAILSKKGDVAERLAHAGLEKVRTEADKRRNGQLILDLVRKVASVKMAD